MKLTSGTNLEDRKLRRKWILKRGGLGLGLGLTISIIILWTIYGILHLIGFASYGIVKGSWAAEEQSIIEKHHHGKIPENSWFKSNSSLFHRFKYFMTSPTHTKLYSTSRCTRSSDLLCEKLKA